MTAGLLFAAGCGGQDSQAGGGEVSVKAGRKLYREHGCPLCHGDEGRGDGRMARALAPPPRDFTRAAEFRLGHSIDAIAEAIRSGVGGRGAMPGYGHLSDGDRRSLAMFVQSLARAP